MAIRSRQSWRVEKAVLLGLAGLFFVSAVLGLAAVGDITWPLVSAILCAAMVAAARIGESVHRRSRAKERSTQS
jgi:uncharacterized membrane protein YfcA